MTHLKLQKLVFYIEAYHLAYFELSLIDDDFEAWLHGPVYRKLWDYYKEKANIYDPLPVPRNKSNIIKSFKHRITIDQIDLIDDVLREYGKDSAYSLECLTHSEAPWNKAREGYAPDDKCEVTIDKNLMTQYYKQNLYGEKQN